MFAFGEIALKLIILSCVESVPAIAVAQELKTKRVVQSFTAYFEVPGESLHFVIEIKETKDK